MDEQLDKTFLETISLVTNTDAFAYSRYMPLLYLKEELSAFEKNIPEQYGEFYERTVSKAVSMLSKKL